MARTAPRYLPKTAIGIHVHAEPRRLEASLASLASNTGRAFDLLLLGDGPDEPTTLTLRDLKTVPQSNTEVAKGTAACFNRLIRHFAADVYVLLESGARVTPGWLGAMLAAIERYPRCGLVGPSTNAGWNEQCIFPATGDRTADIERAAVIAARRFGATCRTLEPLHSLADFCYLVRREVVEALGEADEAYGLGPCWEMDYNIRAFRAGFQAYWACGAYVHRAPVTVRRQQEETARFEASRQLYQNRFCGLRLRGLKDDYRTHCRGSACPNFAPVELIRIRYPRAECETSTPIASTATSLTAAPPKPAAPLVSCIMPTCNRRPFIARALSCFFAQDYPTLELIIVDDGTDAIADLLPPDPRIRYWRLGEKLTIGAKRNYACARAAGQYIIHWDDDDWYPASRVSRQMAPLLQTRAQVSGSSTFFFYNADKRQAFRYQFNSPRAWVGGTTLAYRKSIWERNAFDSIQVGEDTKFVGRVAPELIHDLRDPTLCVASIHAGNASPKNPTGAFWATESAQTVEALLREAAAPPKGESTQNRAREAHAESQRQLPLVSCIMPTYNRRAFIPLSIACFQSQTYPNKELLVVDDGSDDIGDLAEGTLGVRYLRLNSRLSIGAKRNLACQHAAGEFIAHWDDDDWYSPERLTQQLEPLLTGTHDLTGLANSFVLQMPSGQFWTTNDSVHRRMFVGDIHGGTLVYRRSLWLDGIRYPAVNLAEDAAFIRAAADRSKRIRRLGNPGLFIYLRHSSNSWKFDCGRFLDPAGWKTVNAPAGFRSELMNAYRDAVQQAT